MGRHKPKRNLQRNTQKGGHQNRENRNGQNQVRLIPTEKVQNVSRFHHTHKHQRKKCPLQRDVHRASYVNSIPIHAKAELLHQRPQETNVACQVVPYQSMRNQSKKIGNSNFAVGRKEGHENNQCNDNRMSYASVLKKWNANSFKEYVSVRNDGQRQY